MESGQLEERVAAIHVRSNGFCYCHGQVACGWEIVLTIGTVISRVLAFPGLVYGHNGPNYGSHKPLCVT